MSEDKLVQGQVISPTDRPRSYVVETPTGQVERNRSQLQVIPNEDKAEGDQQTETGNNYDSKTKPEPPHQIMTRSRTGASMSKPERLAQQVWDWLKGGDVAYAAICYYLLLILMICVHFLYGILSM